MNSGRKKKQKRSMSMDRSLKASLQLKMTYRQMTQAIINL
eukprot:CAMPEP_0185618598 /NCGR_PEP_ID=MMETSP0436-20130131/47567_1 /TAXON_ID=626734 ORGANISM="Favella taraikaensis, Strain Fe Narragansett Bay" /NCGR_SAMPLE_ID=MMETSP0436 /ASSEMBLY_ACC=CAM_ASM_000390 /LENGTH=39 /DNA_ID= /DNA_START= /DNA_END= /DNA_ORIENTATION=